MIRLFYIGNALSQKGKNATSVETLSFRLRQFCEVKTASDKQNIVLRLLDMVFLVLRHCRKTDFVLIDTYSTLNFYYAFIISQMCRMLRINYIPILHGGNLEKRLKENPKMSRMIFGNAYKLVSPSNFLKERFQSFGYQNVEFIPNTIEINDFEFFNRNIEHIKLFWLRSFSKIYNPKLAVLILDSLTKKGHDAQLCMVGPDSDGSLNETKQLVKKLNLNVKFTGKLPKNEWVERSKDYNIFINTTNFDNTPVSVIEAMALGLPVVSTNVGGLPFLITHNKEGILVSPNDVNAMVDAIIKLKQNKNFKDKLVINARKKVENFDWKEIRAQWKRLLS
ncbi:glycosyl transferase family 1 [Winogradskyella sp. J14-2]|uniref:glycosyltransferase family 4 protein n=1 Tax=Winogradskyella sp. J14-2 TaxID=1936080 RepID=UPI000972C30A|nr:glycosyltransferase family 4 protein [Winogradskyella sp. J14-2]APY07534.1 glycosyl transferase family 1 [Winogradskyella sp. J14-2]